MRTGSSLGLDAHINLINLTGMYKFLINLGIEGNYIQYCIHAATMYSRFHAYIQYVCSAILHVDDFCQYGPRSLC